MALPNHMESILVSAITDSLAVSGASLVARYGLTMSIEDIRAALFPRHDIRTLRNWKSKQLLPNSVNGRFDSYLVAHWWHARVTSSSNDQVPRSHRRASIVNVGRRRSANSPSQRTLGK